MARPEKRRIESGQTTGRTTPKGTNAKARASVSLGDGKPAASTRYTPPSRANVYRPSPIIVPILMFTFFGLGLLMIFLNYVGLLPGAENGSSWYIFGGLSLILLGIITATQYR